MGAYVAPTDRSWFDFLSSRSGVDEVNFWMPNRWGGRFAVLNRGEPLLFKLKAPHNMIAGGGFFEHYTELPISLAWEAFGEKNGAGSLAEVRRSISRLRRDDPRPFEDYTIGCILLVEPFFWPEELWIPTPANWSREIVRGKRYEFSTPIGEDLWAQVADRLQGKELGAPLAARLRVTVPGGYGDPMLIPHRLGQGTFRVMVTDAYHRQCAVTRERALPALEAAHIRPFAEVATHHVQNGLLLRSDVHRLFDAGYITVTPEYRVEASSRMRDDFNDGENYMRLHGSDILLPTSIELHPDPAALRWHNDNCFRG
ncbi:MAG TPA: HNH endonuclease [Longimicrobium sp.]|jgi:putative restriction endonuclease|nr:HNH endonuclease [Longimicrobium sp.]